MKWAVLQYLRGGRPVVYLIIMLMMLMMLIMLMLASAVVQWLFRGLFTWKDKSFLNKHHFYLLWSFQLKVNPFSKITNLRCWFRLLGVEVYHIQTISNITFNPLKEQHQPRIRLKQKGNADFRAHRNVSKEKTSYLRYVFTWTLHYFQIAWWYTDITVLHISRLSKSQVN